MKITVAYTPHILESDSQSSVFTKYNNNENIHFDNNKLINRDSLLENGITVNNESRKGMF